MFTFVKVDFAKALLGRLTASNDTKTTVLGIAAAGLLAANLDWGRLFHGDSVQLGQAAGALVAAAIGYYTNKPDTPKK
jgi:hypothetical protein